MLICMLLISASTSVIMRKAPPGYRLWPDGSLEWAVMATERIRLDPLAKDCFKLGAHQEKMKYVAAPTKAMPFEDNYFDIISSFNSLDHVDNFYP